MILYIDPSVMTYAIQAIAGIIIAIGAFVGIYFRRAKKKINNKLGIDENKNKEVETDEIIVKEETKKEEDAVPVVKKEIQKETKKTNNKTTTKKKSTTKKK